MTSTERRLNYLKPEMKTETEIKTTTVEEAANALFGLEYQHEFMPAVLMGAAKWVTHEGGDTFWDCLRHMVESTDFKMIDPKELNDPGVRLAGDKVCYCVLDFDEHQVEGAVPVSEFIGSIEASIDYTLDRKGSVETELKQLDALISGLSKVRRKVASRAKKKH